jgi:hypothetical protein
LSNMKIIKAFIGVLLSRSGFLLSGIFLIIFKKGVIILMSLEFYCRLQRNFLKLFKILGFYCRWSSVEFFCLWSSTVAIPFWVVTIKRAQHTTANQEYCLILQQVTEYSFYSLLLLQEHIFVAQPVRIIL